MATDEQDGRADREGDLAASGRSRKVRDSTNYWRLAFTGVIFPFLVIVALRFVVGPLRWGDYVAVYLGSELGMIFGVYLLVVAIVAVVWSRLQVYSRRKAAATRRADDSIPK